MSLCSRDVLGRRPARGAAFLATVALVALAGCGGDDSEDTTAADQEQEETVAQLEARLKETVNRGPTAKDDPLRKGVPDVEEVDCPADADVNAVGEGFECELTGGDETGRIGVTVIDKETFNYGGGFGGVGEFAQGITLVPPEEEQGGGQNGGGQGGGGNGGGSG